LRSYLDGTLEGDLWLVRMSLSSPFHGDDGVSFDWSIADHKSALRSSVSNLEHPVCLDSHTWDREAIEAAAMKRLEVFIL
jgi:hypothetical protein